MTKLLSSARSARYARRASDDDREQLRRPAAGKQTRTEQTEMHNGYAEWLAMSLGAAVPAPRTPFNAALDSSEIRTSIPHATHGGLAAMMPDWEAYSDVVAPSWSAAPSPTSAVQRKSSPSAAFDDLSEPGALDPLRAAEDGVAAATASLPFLDAIQHSFGRHDLSQIRAQIGGAAARSARALGAHAYATGARIAFADSPDLHTAAHEAAHVIQQASGAVATGLGATDDAFERAADEIADAVVAGRSAEPLLDRYAPPASAASSAFRTPLPSGAPSPAPVPTAVPAAPVQRKAAQYKRVSKLTAMTLSAFDQYAHSQADWAIGPKLEDSADHRRDRDSLRALLRLARADSGLMLAGCGSFSVSDLLKLLQQDAQRAPSRLQTYSRAAAPSRWNGTVHIQAPAPDAATASQWGDALIELQAGISGLILEQALPQSATYPVLANLIAEPGAVDALVKYFALAHPFLDADTGADITSFIAFKKGNGHTKVATYKKTLPEIRNYHRFIETQLDALEANMVQAQTNAAQVNPLPIAVVMQSSLDHNGAFHRKAALTKVIERATHLTFVAEGKATLAELSAELAKFAKYGRDGKVDEIMVAGHGNYNLIDLAAEKGIGTRGNDPTRIYGNVKNEQLTSSPNVHATKRQAVDDFLDKIKDVLRDDPQSRLVIRGCLTASNNVEGKLDADPATAALQIKAAIAADPSLATYIRDKLGQHQAQVRGANASYADPTLLDAQDNLDIHAASDPELTAPDKLTYAKKGNEPTGVLRATLESWANDRAKTIAALKSRKKARAGNTSWYESIIRATTTIIIANPSDASLIQTLVETASALAHILPRAGSHPSSIKDKTPAAHVNAVFSELATSHYWAAYPHLPAVVFQEWIAKNAAKVSAFKKFLNSTTFTTQNASDLFDLPLIAPRIGSLLPLPPKPAKPPRGAFLLALLWMTKEGAGAPAEAKAFIAAVAGKKKKLPDTSNVAQILHGATPRSVLIDAGVITLAPRAAIAAPNAGPVASSTTPEPNLAPSGTGDNTLVVDSVTKKGKTRHNFGVTAYALPSGKALGTIKSGVELDIIGTVSGMRHRTILKDLATDFYAVEYSIKTHRTVFVRQSDLKLL